MSYETDQVMNYQWLASVIAEHPDATVRGSVRLQNTIWLLQHVGFPSRYNYRKFFDGPYSEAVRADIELLSSLGLIEVESSPEGMEPGYTFRAIEKLQIKELEKFIEQIRIISEMETFVLDCAATYEAFRDLGLPDEEAWVSVCLKKGNLCDEITTEHAKKFLEKLGLLP
ncbi:hypothetical protein [Desulfomonile tiedjei]|uniref:DUF4065 domain-containing protein n=1 Tax=Desulfomonile tiedjei (strain ATCC 49306 / DSM 6799 / DCB-1) TaxID=706587 RepID=I4CCY8_DESTA|nr:hypothetical protein [Desulfomonile tiedjei]AFM27429.1 hypothetical protein Desti_4813 [Desulfomonile tiedjei DSM 6799]